MANDRMWLVHDASRTMTMLAKYYPSTGWYQKYPPDAFFNIASVGHSDPRSFRLVFESSDEWGAVAGYENIAPTEGS